MLIPLPSATSSVESIASWSNPWFTAYFPWLGILLGIFLGCVFIVVLIRAVQHGFFSLFHKNEFDKNVAHDLKIMQSTLKK